MKTLVTLALLLTANLAQASDMQNLVEARRSPGFERDPQTKILRVREDGVMTLEVIKHRQNKKEVKSLGRLSNEGVKQIASQLQGIAKDAELIDEDAGKPMCTDIPGFSVSALVEGEQKEIYRSASCHHYRLEGGAARELEGFARTLLGW